uniref:NEDD8-activating enzyme E1 catalytic subunit n=1 Tax=Proboscia inermis TaxID=420281 RepID=A0A7S0CHK5_9STRA|mmetsp:Transcript_48639/g.49002  ORF Transcript_48639/g.49002 Transcript_48639/m.49002 type:complete len:424 (+) Transcript_48639:21-1292(+)
MSMLVCDDFDTRFINMSPSIQGEFDPSSSASILKAARVLVIGAGGLGCELLKDLAMTGVCHVEVIDLDTIDVTNLNRQFLFRQKDIGKSKAEVAARFINERCPWMEVKYYHGKIQDKPSSFYQSFQCIISGLDNVEARRWLNAMICGLVRLDDDGDPDPDTIIPIIDGGTEGFKGQARVILPRITSCFECSLDTFPPQKLFPMCTIAETPRLPEHCISYAFMLEWNKEFPDKKLDKDSPDDMQWVYKTALKRAEKYKILGVTYSLTMGVVKNIIPAVASTNAVIAAACVNEAVKLITFCSHSLNTYMMYMGSAGVYSHTFVFERKDDCPVCTSTIRNMKVCRKMTLNELIQNLCDGDLRLKKPSITSANSTLYMQKPPALEKSTRKNLDKTLSSLIGNGEELIITDPVFPRNKNLFLCVTFES